MNRDEILAKSRAEGIDEGAREAENRGRKMGVTAFCLMEVAVAAFNALTEQPNYVPLALFWTFLAAEAYPRYRFSKDKSLLVTTIAGGLLSIANLINYVIDVLG